MDKTEVYEDEPFIPTVYAPGAVEVKVELGGGIWGKWNGDNGTNDAEWEWVLDEAGTHDFIAYARYSENGEWQIIGTVQMTVKEPIPLEAPTISVRNPQDASTIIVKNPIDVTQKIIVTVHTVPYGTSYVVEAHSHAEDGKEWPRWEMHDTDAVDGIITVTIPANMLTANEAYWIDCYVDSEHNDYAHGKSENHVGIMTLSGNSTDTNVHLSFKDDSTVRTKEVPVNTDFSVNVSTTESGVTAVALYMGDRIQYQFYNGEALEFTLSDYQPWQETIFARTYKGTDINGKPWEEIDWYHLNWENASEERLSVTFTSKGKADPATINFPGTVIREDPIVINVTLGNNANEAHANLDRSSGHGEEDLVFDNWFDLIPGENTITLPTGNLECGWYKLYVDSSGEGYENNRTSGWVHIAPDPDKVSQKLVLPSGLTEIDEEAFEGTAAEMVVIPASVQSIGSKAFANSRIHLVVLKGNVPDIAGNAFENCELVVIYGPEGSAVDLANAFGAAFYRTN